MQNAQEVLPAVFSRLQENDPRLVDLVTRDLALNDARVTLIGNALPGNTNLTHMSFVNHNFGREGAQALASGLQRNETLLSLSIGNGNIGDSAICFAQILMDNRTLVSFQLTDSVISDEAAEAFAQAIERNRKLNYLNLSRCQMSEAAYIMIFSAFRKNKHITKFELNGIAINQNCAQVVANVLKVNTGLRSVFLEDSQISDACGVMILESLYVNSTLRELNVQKNNLARESAIRLVFLLRERANLQRVIVWENPIDEMLPEIQAALSQNHALMAYDGATVNAPHILPHVKRNRAANVKMLLTMMLGHIEALGQPLSMLQKDVLFILFQEISYFWMSRQHFDRLYSSIAHNQSLQTKLIEQRRNLLPLAAAPVENHQNNNNNNNNNDVNPAPQGEMIPVVEPAHHHQDLNALLDKAGQMAAAMNSKKYWNGRRKAAYINNAITAIREGSEKLPETAATDDILNLFKSKDQKTLSEALAYHRLFSSRQHGRKKSNSLEEFENFRTRMARA